VKRFTFPTNVTFHPLLFALHPILFLYQSNINKVNFGDILLPLVTTFVAVVAVWALLSVITRKVIKAGLAVSLFLILFFSYGQVFSLVRDKMIFHLMINHRLMLPLWSVLFLVGLFLIWFSSTKYFLINKAANFISGVLVILCITSIAAHILGDLGTKNELVKQDKKTSTIQTKLTANSLAPDVYFIVLDSYAGSTALANLYQESNEAFLNALKERKFYVADHSFSNYDNTTPSMASALNMTYVNNIYTENPTEAKQFEHLTAMIDNSAVAQFFESKGYQVHFLNSPSKPKQLDFVDMLYDTTALVYWHTREAHRQHILSTFKEFNKVIKIPGPKFVYAHFDIPHTPFVFGANGQSVTAGLADKKADGTEKPNRYYLEQLLGTNKLILPLLDEILTKPGVKPIIILAADHGPPIGAAGVPSGTIGYRLSILNTYYLPDSASKNLYNSISPVNTFRFVLGQCFGANLPLLPDEHYAIFWSKTGKLTKVEELR